MLERLSLDYFSDGERIASPDYGPVELRRRALAQLLNDEVIDRTNQRETTAPLDIWVDQAAGSDSADGLSEDNPVASIIRATEILPRACLHQTIIHVKEGTYDPFNIVGLHIKQIDPSSRTPAFMIDCETTLKALTTGVNSGNPSTVAKGYFDKPVGAPDWTPGEMDNELLKIIDGPHLGQARIIETNTATRIYFRDYATTWSTSDYFEIHERKVIVDATKGWSKIWGCTTENLGLNSASFVMRGIIFDGSCPDFISCYVDGPSFFSFREGMFRNFSYPGLTGFPGTSTRFESSAFLTPSGFGFGFFAGNVNVIRSIFKGAISANFARGLAVGMSDCYVEVDWGIRFTKVQDVYLSSNKFVGTEVVAQSCLNFDDYDSKWDGSPGHGLKCQQVPRVGLVSTKIDNATQAGIYLDSSYCDCLMVSGVGNGTYGVEVRRGSKLRDSGSNSITSGSGEDIKPGTQPAVAWGTPANDPAEVVGVF